MNVQYRGGSRSFAKETRTLKMRSTVAGHWKLIITNWEDHRSWSSYKYTRSCRRTQRWPFYSCSAFESIRKVPQELTTNQKNRHFVVLSSLTLCNNSKPFLNWIVTCDKKWILFHRQRWPAQWLDCKEAPKHLPKPNSHQKKGPGHYLVVCCASDPLQLSESQWNHSIRGECSANQWGALKTAMPATGIGRQKGPSFIPW